MGTKSLSTGVVYCVVVGIASIASADGGWSGSPAARAWERATGTTIDLATEAPIISEDGTTMQVIDTANGGTVIGEWVYMESRSIPINGSAGTLSTPWGTPMRVRERYTLSSGFIVTNGEQSHFAFLRMDTDAELTDVSGNRLNPSVALNIPIMAFPSASAAEGFMSGIEQVASGSEGDGGLFCFDPKWVGNGNIQCCGYLVALQSEIAACRSEWWMRLWGCIAAGGGAGWVWFEWCIKSCMPPCAAVPPPGNAGCAAGCAKACLVTGGVVGAGGAILCVLASNEAYDACVSRALNAYFTNLTNNGCAIRVPNEDGEIDGENR